MAIKICGSGLFLPHRAVSSTEIDSRLRLPPGTTESKTGVRVRYHVESESLSDMAAKAAERALEDAKITKNEIDVIISAGASPQQLIPCNAVFYQRALGLEESGIPAFDINATCLSFLVALDTASALITAGRYRKALLISSEISSLGLGWKEVESSGLFGDAAAAFVVSAAESESDRVGIIGSVMETYSSGSEYCQLIGGGSALPGYRYQESNHDDYLFKMDGRKLFKHAANQLPETLSRLLRKSQVALDDVAMVIPHQASLSAMTLIRRRLEVPEERWFEIISTHGNCIAASIPMGLHLAMKSNRVKRGDLVLLLGTGAGLSIGATLLRV